MIKIAVFAAFTILQIQASPCGFGPGKDICAAPKDCAPLVVRPHELSPPPPFVPAPPPACMLPPSPPPAQMPNTPCACLKTVVRPAIVPKPACMNAGVTAANQQALLMQQQTLMNTINSQVMSNAALYAQQTAPLVPAPAPQEVLYEPKAPEQLAPADPVSLAIAYKMAQKVCKHNEDSLAFGFKTMPKEMPISVVKKCNNIPEENLHNINGAIVELKKLTCAGKSIDEEAADVLAAEAELELEEPADIAAIRKPSLGEIGYGLAKIANPAFAPVAVANPIEVAQEAAYSKAQACNNGFISGSVQQVNVPRPQSLVYPAALPEPCESAEKDVPVQSTSVFVQPQIATCMPCMAAFQKMEQQQHKCASSSMSFQKFSY